MQQQQQQQNVSDSTFNKRDLQSNTLILTLISCGFYHYKNAFKLSDEDWNKNNLIFLILSA